MKFRHYQSQEAAYSD